MAFMQTVRAAHQMCTSKNTIFHASRLLGKCNLKLTPIISSAVTINSLPNQCLDSGLKPSNTYHYVRSGPVSNCDKRMTCLGFSDHSNNFRQQSACLHTSLNVYDKSASGQNKSTDDVNLIMSQMSTLLLNENGFLSWCRNAYLSTAIGVAMLSGATSALAQGAGAGAFVVGGMNLFWGTGCHVSNLIYLRRATGMKNFTLFLNIFGSILHCFLWLFVVVCFIGFLDETIVAQSLKEEQEKQFAEHSV